MKTSLIKLLSYWRIVLGMFAGGILAVFWFLIKTIRDGSINPDLAREFQGWFLVGFLGIGLLIGGILHGNYASKKEEERKLESCEDYKKDEYFKKIFTNPHFLTNELTHADKLFTNILKESNQQTRYELLAFFDQWQTRVRFVDELQEGKDKQEKNRL